MRLESLEKRSYFGILPWAALAGHGETQRRVRMVLEARGDGYASRGGLGDVPRVRPRPGNHRGDRFRGASDFPNGPGIA